MNIMQKDTITIKEEPRCYQCGGELIQIGNALVCYECNKQTVLMHIDYTNEEMGFNIYKKNHKEEDKK